MSPSAELDYLLSPRAIRERAAKIFSLAMRGGTHFEIHAEKLDEVADFVLEVTRANYPDLKIPFHSRWGHFKVGKVDRVATLEPALTALGHEERARAKLDLAVVSVLLDAGAGPSWKFREPDGGEYARSEGLAVASFHLFRAGAFSLEPAKSPLRVDAAALANLKLSTLERGFQVSRANPLVGLDGRLALLRSLGRALVADPAHFPGARPGGIFDWAKRQGKSLHAVDLLKAVLKGFGPIWPGRATFAGLSLGDAWAHAELGKPGSFESFVPFHKLSQWLTYSLIEPIEDANIRVTRVDEMTGLAEYRNGGLILDKGLIVPRDPSTLSETHEPASATVVEWRALTIHFLDRLGERMREKLGRTAEQFPLARVLEGGTWWAGRRAAAEARPGGGPPLRIESDGTVF